MGKEPHEIRQDIEETRSRMGDTVEAIGYKADVKSRAKESISNKKDDIVSSMRNVKDNVVGSIAGTGESIAGSVGNMKDATVSTAQSTTPSAGDVKRQARRAAGMAQENPWGLALGSFAVGFLAGMVVPATRVEEERIGPVATQMREKATETGREALERGKQVVQETAQVARDAAGEAAQKTMDTAKETGQQQGQDLASSAQENVQDMRGGGSMPPGGTGDLERTGPESKQS
jgi:hypothetical protein